MVGALIIAVVIVFVLPVAFLLSGGIGAAVLGWLLMEEAEAAHAGSELIETNR